MHTLAISNYKGGVGKTTTAVYLASIYARQGKRILLIDLDPQASATDYFGAYEAAETPSKNSVGLLYQNKPVSEVAHITQIDNLSLIPWTKPRSNA